METAGAESFWGGKRCRIGRNMLLKLWKDAGIGLLSPNQTQGGHCLCMGKVASDTGREKGKMEVERRQEGWVERMNKQIFP